jgi:hypothetical protein
VGSAVPNATAILAKLRAPSSPFCRGRGKKKFFSKKIGKSFFRRKIALEKHFVWGLGSNSASLAQKKKRKRFLP